MLKVATGQTVGATKQGRLGKLVFGEDEPPRIFPFEFREGLFGQALADPGSKKFHQADLWFGLGENRDVYLKHSTPPATSPFAAPPNLV